MKNKKGFTLIEIIIVVVIIGLLAAMVIPAFNQVRQESREKAMTKNLRQIASAAQHYILEEDVESVSYSALVDGGYLTDIQTVDGESYVITVSEDTNVIRAAGNDGATVTYTF